MPMTSRDGDRREPARACTRARRRSSSTWRRGSRRRSAWRATRGRWTARASWASCCWRRRAGTTITITADGADEQAAVDALAALVESGFGEDACERLNGIGVSPGVVAGRAVILIQRAQVLRFPIAAGRVAHELARARAEPRPRRASSCATSARASRGAAGPSWRRSSTRSC